MTILYKSASGREVTHASSSSLDTFRLCRRKFKLSRIDGWRQKDKKASLEFGKCLESALQFYHQNGLKPGDGVDEFQRLWAKWVEQPLVYTDQEGSWQDLNTMGKEMLRLYEIVLPNLPLKNLKFQLQFLKKLWPGTNLDALEFMAYIDMLSTLEDGSRLLVDIKTAKSELPVTSNMIALDGQLRKYAWVSGINEVGFLNFVKARPDDFKKGTNLTILTKIEEWIPGTRLVVAKYDSEAQVLYVASEETVQKMDEEMSTISGKGATVAKEAVFLKYLESRQIGITIREHVTKTKIQFVRGTIPDVELQDVGQALGLDVFALKSAHEAGFYPKDGGVRFPNAICGWCEFNCICLGDDKKRDETLVQIGPKVDEDAWLKELEGEAE